MNLNYILAGISIVLIINSLVFYFKYQSIKANFRMTLEATSDIVFLCDNTIHFVDVYASRKSILLGSRDTIIGRAPEQTVGPELGRRTRELLVKVFEDGQRQTLNYQMELSGETRFFEAVMERRDSKIVVITVRDVTERKNLQQQLEIERAKQFESARLASLGEMAGGVSHEINTPLSVVLGSSQYLQVILKTEPLQIEKAKKEAERIENTALRISKIVKGLKSLAREGSQDAMEVVKVESIVQNTLALCAEKFRAHGVDMSLDLQEHLNLFCRPVQISQILLNLLNNSFQALHKSSIASKQIQVSAKKLSDGQIEIAVEDNGPGIPVELRHRIFNPFFTTKPSDQGTGLGLSISTSLAVSNNAVLALDTEFKLTRFYLRFSSIAQVST